MTLPPVCILAGGLGTRLGHRVADTPKPLVQVAGQPFLFHQLRLLAAHGAERVVLCVGYLGEMIEAEVGTQHFGIEIEYSYDSPGLDGTLGALRRAASLLGDRFLVLYGDTYLQLDYRAAVRAWMESGLPAMMTVFRNQDRWDTSNVIYADGRVLVYDKTRRSSSMLWIDYGLGGLEACVIAEVDAAEPDLAALYRLLAGRRRLFGYEVHERFYEIGTPAALAETETFLGRRLALEDEGRASIADTGPERPTPSADAA